MAYQLPTESAGQFKQFFSDLDESLDQLGIRSYGVGITTLEEVFLKIGHGEEVEQERFEKGPERENNYGNLNSNERVQEQDLDDYSITNGSDYSTFQLLINHMCAIMRKKILMQVRDKKTLGIDTIFPIILILAGLALSTVAIFKNGVSREMSATLYPTPLKIIQNSQSAFSNQSYIEAFVKNNMVDNS